MQLSSERRVLQMKNFLTVLTLTLSITAIAQTQPLVVLDGYFIKRDKATTLSDVGLENIKDTTFVKVDSAIQLIEEHGKNGLFVIETTRSKEQKGTPQDLYFNNPPLLLINHIQSNMKDLNQLNPEEIDSIWVRPPLEMVQIRGLDMVGGIILIYTKLNEPLNESLLADSTLTVDEKQIKLPTFQLELKLSRLAEKELKKSKESIVIVAYIRGTLKNSDEENEYQIGEYTMKVTSERIVTLDDVYVSKKKFDKLEDPNFEVLINVFSGRESSQFNILDVDILQESIEQIKGKRHYLKGRLISEM
tara:strand:- start:184 stop:1095 length:912 start_codon:yes stop_codon:yes gene_type:complete